MKKLLFLTLLFTTAFTACKKDDPTPTYPIEGYWVGKYGNGSATPASGFSMVVESGGVMTIADGATITNSSKAAGTWTLVDGIFTATYTYTSGGTYSVQATFTNDGKLTNGTWGPNNSTSGSGTWFMNRTN
jgi:hypothetical protein